MDTDPTGRREPMSTSATGEATDEPNRYEPFGDGGYRRTEERPAGPEREAPEAVAPMIFQTGDDDRSS